MKASPTPSPAPTSDLENIVRTAKAYATSFEEVEPLAIEVAMLLGRAAVLQRAALDHLFHSLRLERAPGRYSVLRVLYFADGKRMPQFAIGSQMNITSASVTNLVDGLEKEGLIIRVPDESDRRVFWVVLTPHGERVCQELIPAMIDFMASMTEGFSIEEKKQFGGFLRRFRMNALSRA